MEHTLGKELYRGKTKIIHEVLDSAGLVIPGLVGLQNTEDITKNDDPTQTQVLVGKGEYATTTTCAVFELLRAAGIPVAYIGQYSKNTFLARKCRMIPLEVIARRFAVGSYIKRRPDLEGSKKNPHRFHALVIELFLKTTGLNIVDHNGNQIGTTPVDDPFIANPNCTAFQLYHPKKPHWDPDANLKIAVPETSIIPSNITKKDIILLTRKTFLVLEAAFAILGLRLIDFKIEFGVDEEGNLYVADVIDNDSWRVRDADWNELSKQLFRDCADMTEITEKYALVAALVQKFRIPQQAIVLWRGSNGDPSLCHEVPEIAGITVVDVVASGHKSPHESLTELNQVLAKFPEGGVILPIVGMSNGLGPMLAAQTNWPVITVPVNAKEYPEDVWSSLRTPSNVPLATVLNVRNAILLALNVLGMKNPIASMHRQFMIEAQDSNY